MSNPRSVNPSPVLFPLHARPCPEMSSKADAIATASRNQLFRRVSLELEQFVEAKPTALGARKEGRSPQLVKRRGIAAA